MYVCPLPSATCMSAHGVLSGKAVMGHVLVMLITEMLVISPRDAQGQL